PRPPLLQLFPYTTLFRSREGLGRLGWILDPTRLDGVTLALEEWVGAGGIAHDASMKALVTPPEGVVGAFTRRGSEVERFGYPNGDRKSTRLNSSHVKISY